MLAIENFRKMQVMAMTYFIERHIRRPSCDFGRYVVRHLSSKAEWFMSKKVASELV